MSNEEGVDEDTAESSLVCSVDDSLELFPFPLDFFSSIPNKDLVASTPSGVSSKSMMAPVLRSRR